MNSKNLLLITTGGTIDVVHGTKHNIYDPYIGEPVAPSILRRLGPGELRFTHIKLFQEDNLNALDQQAVTTACAGSGNQKILITHGTDTMIETGLIIEKDFRKGGLLSGKTIVLTGALQPACMKDGDAEFNLGAAFMACNTLQPGVYIVMHGKVFTPSECEKCEDGYFRRRKTKAAA